MPTATSDGDCLIAGVCELIQGHREVIRVARGRVLHDDGDGIASDVRLYVSEVQSVGILPHQSIMSGGEVCSV